MWKKALREAMSRYEQPNTSVSSPKTPLWESIKTSPGLMAAVEGTRCALAMKDLRDRAKVHVAAFKRWGDTLLYYYAQGSQADTENG